MPQCRYENFASTYLDGELSPEERTTFEAHLEQCPLCQAAIAEMRDIDDSLRAGSDRINPNTGGQISSAVQLALSRTGEFARVRRRKWWRKRSDSFTAYAVRMAILLVMLVATIVAANKFTAQESEPTPPPSAGKVLRAVPPEAPMPGDVLARAEVLLADLVRTAGQEPGAAKRIGRQVLEAGLLAHLGAVKAQALDPTLKENLSRLETALLWMANVETDAEGAELAATIQSAELPALARSLTERLRNEGG